MNKQTKKILKSGLLSGIGYAGFMAAFDYADGQDFRIWRFLFNALFFGLAMSVLSRYSAKKQGEE
jgi:hypothetical protein